MDSLSTANVEFCLDMFKELNNNNVGDNIFFSPLSLLYALSMILLGARGNSAQQVEKVLHFNHIAESLKPEFKGSAKCSHAGRIHSEFGVLFSQIIQPDSNYTLSIANRLYGTKAMSFHQQYLSCSEKFYQARLQTVDFEQSTEETRQTINAWVERKTNGKIKNVVLESSISSSAVMLLVNAVYFKGKWESAFIKKETINCRFKSPKCPGKPVALMYQERKFNLSVIQDPYMQILELKYHGGISMYVMLPESDLSQIENKLTFQNLMNWTNPRKMSAQYVKVFLPQFKIEKNYEIKRNLKALGLKDIFSESRADFSGIASGGRLYLSKLMHKSYIEVTEDGTEAAAISESNVVEKLLPESTVFRADHPFIFVIRKNDVILFSGKVSCP
ncbi:serpin B7-like isoform X2 [Pteropus vampyrus]|uniref:Serpin B7 n=1 Tax=Pteropus vampyrus TaxID=132908 RepID=A0A6P6CHT4_PTEVA|nr:serpin B7-like isoform X2 [Pteropus vampyrus]